MLKAEKTGDRKVLFTFRDNTNKELPLILGQLPVLPSKWWANRDFEKVSLDIPLGSGAYKVDSFDVGRSIAYRRVDDWWAKDLWMNRGRNNFEVMRYEYYRDVTVQFEAFKAGDIDIRQENIARNWATAYDIPPVRDGRITARRDPARAADRHAVLRLQHAARLTSRTSGCARRSPPCSTSPGPTRTCSTGCTSATSRSSATPSSPRRACRRRPS